MLPLIEKVKVLNLKKGRKNTRSMLLLKDQMFIPQITFITLCRYNCSILLVVIIVNLSLYLIYKLNFIIGTYI